MKIRFYNLITHYFIVRLRYVIIISIMLHRAGEKSYRKWADDKAFKLYTVYTRAGNAEMVQRRHMRTSISELVEFSGDGADDKKQNKKC